VRKERILIIVLCCIFLSGTSAFASPYTPVVPFFFGVPQEGTAPLTISFTDASDGDVSTWMWEFGDGATSRQTNPTHQYREPGYYSVTLTVSGPGGTDTLTRLGYIFVSEPEPQEGIAISSFVITNLYETGFVFDDGSHVIQQQIEGSGAEESAEEEVAPHTIPTIAPEPLSTPLNEMELSNTELAVQENGNGEEIQDLEETSEITPEPALLPDPLFPRMNAEPQTGMAPLRVSFTDASIGEITEWIWIFGDGLSSVAANPIHIYEKPGDYTVYLTVAGPGGVVRVEEPVQISVAAPWVSPRASFTADPIEGMVPLTVRFTDTSTGDVEERTWSLGDKTEANDPIVEHTYTKAGTYPISLVVTGYDRTTDRSAGFITVLPLPAPPAPEIECSTIGALEIICNVIMSSDVEDVSWLWEFGDGSTSTEPSPVHHYEAFETYVISVTVTDTYEQTGFSSIELSLDLPPLDGTFTYEIDSQNPMTFIFTGVGQAESWNWEFGDGVREAGQVVTHTYNTTGDMSVTLTIADSYQQEEIIQTVSISAPPLDGTFTYEVDNQNPMTFIFTGVGEAESWSWEFGDGVREAGQVVTHTYNTTGDMSVTLTIADSYQEKEITQLVTIYAPPLDGTFTYEVDNQNPMTFIFTGVGEAESWNWEFGDGVREAGQVVTHTYNTTGDMSVTLTIADSYQEKGITQTVAIYAPPIDVDFAIALSDAHEPYTISFFDRSYGPITSWQWYFGDGAASKEQNPVHTYGSAGEYTVQLIITSEYGDTQMQQVRFIIPESVPDKNLSNLSKPDLDVRQNETVITQSVTDQTVINETSPRREGARIPIKQMAEITEI